MKKLAALEPTAWVSEEVPWKRSTADAAVEGASHLKMAPWRVHLTALHHGWTARWLLHGDGIF